MATTAIPAASAARLRQLRIVVLSLIASIAALAVITVTLVSAGIGGRHKELAPLLIPILFMLAMSAAGVSLLLRRTRIRALESRWPAGEPPVEETVRTYAELALLSAALIEATGTFAVVLYFLAAHPIALMAIGGCFIVLLLQLPSEEGLRGFIAAIRSPTSRPR
jgi:hypothetical protein